MKQTRKARQKRERARAHARLRVEQAIGKMPAHMSVERGLELWEQQNMTGKKVR